MMREEKLGQGAGHERKRGSGREGEPEHFVKQGKMRLHRGTTAAFLSLQNYVFRRPPPYLSKHNKFPLCLSCPPLPTRPPTHPPRPTTTISSFFALLDYDPRDTTVLLSSSTARLLFLPAPLLFLFRPCARGSPRSIRAHTHGAACHVFPQIHVHRFPTT